MSCHCGKNLDFTVCCQPLIEGQQTAPSAEALMRSRYSAFVIKNMDYLLKTQDPQTRDEFDLQSNQEWADSVVFLGLEILRSEESGNKAQVEFKARFQEQNSGIMSVHHEISKFRQQKGVWYFRSGKIVAES